MGNSYIFYHIYCNDHTLPIVKDQITKIVFSGLYSHVNSIYCFLSGNIENINIVQSYINNQGAKFIIVDVGENDTSYERFTLLKIKYFIKEDDIFLYFHTKGVTKPNSDAVYTWRNIMEYFLIGKYNECISKLHEYDTVGIMWNNMPWPHFSGNFWWSTGKYFLSLPNYINPYEYLAPEAYIGTNAPSHFSFYQTSDNCYETYIPFSKYIDLH